MLKSFLLSSTLAVLLFPATVKAAVNLKQEALDATEKLLESNSDPQTRLQLLQRWARLKQEVHNEENEEIKHENIVNKLENEISNLEENDVDNLDPLYRTVGRLLFEIGETRKAALYLDDMQKRNPHDELLFGDALFANGLPSLSMSAYEKATKDSELRGLAYYKLGWAQLQTGKMELAQDSFLNSLYDDKAPESVKLASFEDLLTPYIQNFQRDSFDSHEMQKWQKHASQLENEEDVFITAMQNLVTGFADSGEVKHAREVFDLTPFEENKSTLKHASLWLRSYRGYLAHSAIKEVLQGLDQYQGPQPKDQDLATELLKTIEFYQSLKDSSQNQEAYQETLKLTYKLMNTLFPEHPENKRLRRNQARIELEAGEYERCMDKLEASKRESSKASKLYELCYLSKLESLYTQREEERKDFEIQLIGAFTETTLLSHSTEIQDGLWQMLDKALIERPFSGRLTNGFDQLRTELNSTQLNVIASHHELEKVLQDPNLNSREKTKRLRKIIEENENPVFLSEHLFERASHNKHILLACDQLQTHFSEESGGNLNRCTQAAEKAMDIEREYEYWSAAQQNLNDDQKLKLHFLGLALEKPNSQERLKELNHPKAELLLSNWNSLQYTESEIFETTLLETQTFLQGLETVDPKQVDTVVEKALSQFHQLQDAWADIQQTSQNPYETARSLEIEAQLLGNFVHWMKELPPPAGLSESEMKQYQTEARQVIDTWQEASLRAQKNCGKDAYQLFPFFTPKSKDRCPFQRDPQSHEKKLVQWRTEAKERATPNIKESQRGISLLQRAQLERQASKAKYFLLRSLHHLEKETNQARAYRRLAELTDSPNHWLAAYQLDPYHPGTIMNLKAHAYDNPFYFQLYQTKLQELKTKPKLLARGR